MESADFVIIGGGVLGGAVAYYLAKQGAKRIVLLERHLVAQGNSSLAAGLLTLGRLKPDLIPMVRETYKAIEGLEETGDPLGMHQTGCLYAAISQNHQTEIRNLASISAGAGLEVEWMDLTDAEHLVPWLRIPRDSFLVFMPEDGYIDGYRLASGYINGARRLGAEIREQTPVLSILHDENRVTGVRTAGGTLSAPVVIDAAGVWAGALAYELGIGLPMAPVRSHYWITAPHAKVSPDQPFVILPDVRAYARPEGDRLLFGLREPRSVSLDPRELPESMTGFRFKQDPYGWDSLIEGIPDLEKFIPMVEEMEISNYVRGLSNYTPDGMFVLGSVPGFEGFLAATGCTGAGMAMSGGFGRAVSELALGLPPFVDLSPHRIDRFGVVDPFDRRLLQQCGDARAGKITG